MTAEDFAAVREALEILRETREFDLAAMSRYTAALASLQAAYEAMERERDSEKALRIEVALLGQQTVERLEAAERERDETALLARVAEWREGLVNVLDHEGNYLGCMGTESWQWTLDGGIAKLKARLEAAQRERDALQHIIDCADTPLMRDVLRERDELGAALRRIADGAESNTASEVAQVARRALASGKDKP